MNGITLIMDKLESICGNKISDSTLMLLSCTSIRDSDGLHIIMYTEWPSSNEDEIKSNMLLRNLQSVHDYFVDNTKLSILNNYADKIIKFEKEEGIDFYTLLSYLYISEIDKVDNSTDINMRVAIDAASILANY